MTTTRMILGETASASSAFKRMTLYVGSVRDALIGKTVQINRKKGTIKRLTFETHPPWGWRYVIYLNEYKRPIYVRENDVSDIQILQR